MKPYRIWLFPILFLIFILTPSHILAQDGVVVRPYWTFRTEAPVSQVSTGDINGDGVPEVVVLTGNNTIYVLDQEGNIAWRHEAGLVATGLVVADFDADGRTVEIFVSGRGEGMLLSETQKPAWYWRSTGVGTIAASAAADLTGDGRPEIIVGGDSVVAISPESGGHYSTDWQSSELGGTAVQSVRDLWAGDLQGDGQVEVLPSVVNDNSVYVLRDTDFDEVWQRRLDEAVGLVQGGDIDANGRQEIMVLTTDWNLVGLDDRGQTIWQRWLVPPNENRPGPTPGELQVSDLDGDQRAEILVLVPSPDPVLYVFDVTGGPAGTLAWKHSFDAESTTGWSAGQILVRDLTGDGQAELIVAATGTEQLYLLAANGQRLAEYRPEGPVTAIDYADLNGDDHGEIVVGTDVGVQLFGTSADVNWQQRWRSPSLAATRVTALTAADINHDGRQETVAGLQTNWLFALADDGRILWDLNLGGAIQAVATGDVNGDGQPEIAVGTVREGGQLSLYQENEKLWTVRLGAINELLMPDLDGDGRAEILVASGTTRGLVQLRDGGGQIIWRKRFEEAVTALGADHSNVWVGTESGRAIRLSAANGSLLGEFILDSAIVSLEDGLAVTSNGQVYELRETTAVALKELPVTPLHVEHRGTSLVALHPGGVSIIEPDGLRIPVLADGEVSSMTTSQDQVIIVGTETGQVHLFGPTLNQPPLLTRPNLSETRSGYAYSIGVNDPDRDPLPVTLEVWDPSSGSWLAFETQTSTGQERLVWDGLAPFDPWDSGRESRYRFSYVDNQTQHTTAEVAGPLTIPTIPWYVYYGQRLGLGVLILLVPFLGWLFYRRQQTYRHSQVGRAEALLRELQANPDEALTRLHITARMEPELLAHLPGLAVQAGAGTLADLSEGFYLLLSRPEVTAEALRTIIKATKDLPHPPATATGLPPKIIVPYERYLQAVEANTISRIVVFQSRLQQLKAVIADSHPPLLSIRPALNELDKVARTLHNSQRVDIVEDKITYLAQAIERLSRFEQAFGSELPQPERNIFLRIAALWLVVATNTLQDLQGRAQIEVSLKTRRLLSLEQSILSLEVTNAGRSPASNLTVALLPGEDFTTNGSTIRLDMLPAGRSSLVEFPVSCTHSSGQFRAEFSLTYDDRESSGKSVAFADVVQLLRPAAEFAPLPNPYAPGTPLRPGSPIFFGRADLFQFIAENMAGVTRQNILVLIGQRRMGKTSFLQQLPAHLSNDFLPVYIDGQSLGIDPGMANFFYDMALTIVDTLADHGFELDEPQADQFVDRPSGVFERTFLPTVFKTIGERELLLLFDEFEELQMRVDSGKLEPTIFSFLRHLMQHEQRLGFVFVGTHRLEALSSDYWSIFFNIALYKHVTFLDEDAARALVINPVADYGLLYDDLALDKLLRVTAGHPYFLQLTCHALVNRANREQRGYITIQDVNNVLGDLVELGEAHFAFLWEQADCEEQLVLTALSRLLNQERSVATTRIFELLAGRGVSLTLAQTSKALRRLAERDIVRELGGQPPHYEYKIELIRLWIETYKPLGQIIELSRS